MTIILTIQGCNRGRTATQGFIFQRKKNIVSFRIGTPSCPPFLGEPSPPQFVCTLSFWSKLKTLPLFLRAIQIVEFTKSIENIIIITLYTFRLNSVFTNGTCFDYMLPLMFLIFDIQEEWTWNISNNNIIKSDMCIKLKYIWISLDIYQHISCHAESKRRKKLTFNNQLWKYMKCLTSGSI